MSSARSQGVNRVPSSIATVPSDDGVPLRTSKGPSNPPQPSPIPISAACEILKGVHNQVQIAQYVLSQRYPVDHPVIQAMVVLTKQVVATGNTIYKDISPSSSSNNTSSAPTSMPPNAKAASIPQNGNQAPLADPVDNGSATQQPQPQIPQNLEADIQNGIQAAREGIQASRPRLISLYQNIKNHQEQIACEIRGSVVAIQRAEKNYQDFGVQIRQAWREVIQLKDACGVYDPKTNYSSSLLLSRSPSNDLFKKPYLTGTRTIHNSTIASIPQIDLSTYEANSGSSTPSPERHRYQLSQAPRQSVSTPPPPSVKTSPRTPPRTPPDDRRSSSSSGQSTPVKTTAIEIDSRTLPLGAYQHRVGSPVHIQGKSDATSTNGSSSISSAPLKIRVATVDTNADTDHSSQRSDGSLSPSDESSDFEDESENGSPKHYSDIENNGNGNGNEHGYGQGFGQGYEHNYGYSANRVMRSRYSEIGGALDESRTSRSPSRSRSSSPSPPSPLNQVTNPAPITTALTPRTSSDPSSSPHHMHEESKKRKCDTGMIGSPMSDRGEMSGVNGMSGMSGRRHPSGSRESSVESDASYVLLPRTTTTQGFEMSEWDQRPVKKFRVN